jgi:hypothetical protein
VPEVKKKKKKTRNVAHYEQEKGTFGQHRERIITGEDR